MKHFYATIIAVSNLYGPSRDDFADILGNFMIFKKKEKKVFGEFISKRKYLKEGDRIEDILGAEEVHL